MNGKLLPSLRWRSMSSARCIGCGRLRQVVPFSCNRVVQRLGDLGVGRDVDRLPQRSVRSWWRIASSRGRARRRCRRECGGGRPAGPGGRRSRGRRAAAASSSTARMGVSGPVATPSLYHRWLGARRICSRKPATASARSAWACASVAATWARSRSRWASARSHSDAPSPPGPPAPRPAPPPARRSGGGGRTGRPGSRPSPAEPRPAARRGGGSGRPRARRRRRSGAAGSGSRALRQIVSRSPASVRARSPEATALGAAGATAARLGPWGRSPESASYSSAPTPYTSVAVVTSSPELLRARRRPACTTPPVRVRDGSAASPSRRATPKSRTTARGPLVSSVTSTLDGLRSRCSTSRPCA